MTNTLITKRLLGAAILAAALITPAIASAQDIPAYAAPADQHVQGTIASINGTWNLTVNDTNGYSDSVELHQGTIINPTGLTLEPGMNVSIAGYPDGSNFDATEIDTPYHYAGPPPAAVYYGPGAWYPGYAYGWGPSFSLVFNLGSRNFEQRAFSTGGARPVSFVPQARTFAAPQRSFAPPQRSFSPPQRSFAAPQRSFAPPAARTGSAPRGNPDDGGRRRS
jgi:hypothetical protein